MDKGLGRPPNPSRLANGQGFRPPPPHPSRLANGQGLRAPQPFMTWGRPPNGQGLGPPPNLHDLQMDKGCPPQPFTTCRWTRVGGPNPSRLANGRGLGAPQPFTTCKPQTLFGQALGPPNHRTLEHISQGTGSVSTDRNINDKPFVPECTLEQVLNFA